MRSLAEQWFGVFMRPKKAADAWLLKGLAGWLEGQFVKRYMGRNEHAYRSLPHILACPHVASKKLQGRHVVLPLPQCGSAEDIKKEIAGLFICVIPVWHCRKLAQLVASAYAGGSKRGRPYSCLTTVTPLHSTHAGTCTHGGSCTPQRPSTLQTFAAGSPPP